MGMPAPRDASRAMLDVRVSGEEITQITGQIAYSNVRNTSNIEATQHTGGSQMAGTWVATCETQTSQ